MARKGVRALDERPVGVALDQVKRSQFGEGTGWFNARLARPGPKLRRSGRLCGAGEMPHDRLVQPQLWLGQGTLAPA